MSDKKKYYSVNEELNDYKKETADLKKDLATAKQRIEWLSNRAYRIKPTDDNDGELWSNFACDNDMTRLARIEDLEKELGEIKERSAKLLEALNIRAERSLDVGKILNTSETEKNWEKNFYESEWNCNTLKLTEVEKKMLGELTTFLPRHMYLYDWNLPYAEEIILIVRRHIKAAIATGDVWEERIMPKKMINAGFTSKAYLEGYNDALKAVRMRAK